MQTPSIGSSMATLLLGALLHVTPCVAADTDGQSLQSGFAKLYLTLCMQHLADLPGFREQLTEKNLPKLPAERAREFLKGQDGDAWPVPYQGQLGNYVLVLMSHQSLCMLYGRREDADVLEQDFKNLMSHASAPMESKIKTDEFHDAQSSGQVHTIGYVWSLIDIPK